MSENLFLHSVDLFDEFIISHLTLVIIGLLQSNLTSLFSLDSLLLGPLGCLTTHFDRFQTILFSVLLFLALSQSHSARKTTLSNRVSAR